MPNGAQEVNAICTIFRNLHATCNLFATVLAGWKRHAIVIGRGRETDGSMVVRSGRLLMSGMAVLALAAVAASAAEKAGKPAQRAEVLQKLINCRSIADDRQRLTCYETQAAAIDSAEANRDVVVIDRDQADKARKQSFGLPARPLVVGTPAGASDGIVDITSKIRTAKLLVTKRWLLELEDGARWYQAELKTLRDPKPGQSVRIRKASLGGYLANIDGQPATRVRRIDQR
jgi:hypothetical protein